LEVPPAVCCGLNLHLDLFRRSLMHLDIVDRAANELHAHHLPLPVIDT
jgi:hypothetical protein